MNHHKSIDRSAGFSVQNSASKLRGTVENNRLGSRSVNFDWNPRIVIARLGGFENQATDRSLGPNHVPLFIGLCRPLDRFRVLPTFQGNVHILQRFTAGIGEMKFKRGRLLEFNQKHICTVGNAIVLETCFAGRHNDPKLCSVACNTPKFKPTSIVGACHDIRWREVPRILARGNECTLNLSVLIVHHVTLNRLGQLQPCFLLLEDIERNRSWKSTKFSSLQNVDLRILRNVPLPISVGICLDSNALDFVFGHGWIEQRWHQVNTSDGLAVFVNDRSKRSVPFVGLQRGFL